MDGDDELGSWQEQDDLQFIANLIQKAAQNRQHDSIALLALLRMLEELHQGIRETLFRDALPENRQKLYLLLRDIEVNGGWPYIQRMKLRSLLQYLEGSTSEPESLRHDGTR